MNREGHDVAYVHIMTCNHGHSDVQVKNHGDVHLLKCLLLRRTTNFKEYQRISLSNIYIPSVLSHGTRILAIVFCDICK